MAVRFLRRREKRDLYGLAGASETLAPFQLIVSMSGLKLGFIIAAPLAPKTLLRQKVDVFLFRRVISQLKSSLGSPASEFRAARVTVKLS